MEAANLPGAHPILLERMGNIWQGRERRLIDRTRETKESEMPASRSPLIWDLTREELNALSYEAPAHEAGQEHFFICSECGQAVDRRQLGDVVYHELQADHEPLLLN